MFNRGGHSKAPRQVFYNVAWASSLGGLAVLAEERRRQLAFAQRLIENGKKLQAHKSYQTNAPLAEFDLGEGWDTNLPNIVTDINTGATSPGKSLTNHEWRRKRRVTRPIPTNSPSVVSKIPPQTPTTQFTNTPKYLDKHNPAIHLRPVEPTASQQQYAKQLQEIIARHVLECLGSSDGQCRQSGLNELRAYFNTEPIFLYSTMHDAVSRAWELSSDELEPILTSEIRRNMLKVLTNNRPAPEQSSTSISNEEAQTVYSVRYRGAQYNLDHRSADQDARATDIQYFLSQQDYPHAFYIFSCFCDSSSMPLSQSMRHAIQDLLCVSQRLSLFSVISYIYQRSLQSFEAWQIIYDDVISLFAYRTPIHFTDTTKLLTQPVLSQLVSVTTNWFLKNGYHDEMIQIFCEAIKFEICHFSKGQNQLMVVNVLVEMLGDGLSDRMKHIYTQIQASLPDIGSQTEFVSQLLSRSFQHLRRPVAVELYLDCVRQSPQIIKRLGSGLQSHILREAFGSYSDKVLVPTLDSLIGLLTENLPFETLESTIRTGLARHSEQIILTTISAESRACENNLKRFGQQLLSLSEQVINETELEPLAYTQSQQILSLLRNLLKLVIKQAGIRKQYEIVEEVCTWAVATRNSSVISECFIVLLQADLSKINSVDLPILLQKFQYDRSIPVSCAQAVIRAIENTTGSVRAELCSDDFIKSMPSGMLDLLSKSTDPNIVRKAAMEANLSNFINGDVYAIMDYLSKNRQELQMLDASTLTKMYRAFASKGPVAQTKDFLQSLPKSFMLEEATGISSSHSTLLLRIWKATANFSYVDEVFQLIKNTLCAASNSAPKLYSQMIMLSLEAGELEMTNQLIAELRARINDTSNIQTSITAAYMCAKACDWNAVREQLDQAELMCREHTRGLPAEALSSLNKIFNLYCQAHSPDEAITYLSDLTSRFSIDPSRIMMICVMEQIVKDEDLSALDSWILFLKVRQLPLIIGEDSIQNLLYRITQSPFVKYTSKGEKLWRNATQRNVDHYKQIFDKLRSMQDTTKLKKQTSVVRKRAKTSLVKSTEREMLVASRVGNHRQVVQMYKDSLTLGIPNQALDLEIAVRASLKANQDVDDEARALINDAEDAGVNIDRASRALRFHNLLTQDLTERQMIDVVHDYYNELKLAGLQLHHHTTIAAVQKLLERGDSAAAVRILHEIYQSKWCREKQFDIPMMTTLIRAHSHAADVTGIRWVTDAILSLNLRVDIILINTVQSARAWCRKPCETRLEGSATIDSNMRDIEVIQGCILDLQRRRNEQRLGSLAFSKILAQRWQQGAKNRSEEQSSESLKNIDRVSEPRRN